MSDAAERIWATCGEYWRYPTFKDDKTEYVRADLSDGLLREAMVALGAALLWTDEEHDVADFRDAAEDTLAKLRAHLEGEKE